MRANKQGDQEEKHNSHPDGPPISHLDDHSCQFSAATTLLVLLTVAEESVRFGIRINAAWEVRVDGPDFRLFIVCWSPEEIVLRLPDNMELRPLAPDQDELRNWDYEVCAKCRVEQAHNSVAEGL